jgi:DNA-binding transcriptional ArsR family regulator
VTDIYTELQLPQPLISKHLRILKEQGILDFTRHGNKILYTFATDSRLMLLNSYISRFAAVGQNCCAENKGN